MTFAIRVSVNFVEPLLDKSAAEFLFWRVGEEKLRRQVLMNNLVGEIFIFP